METKEYIVILKKGFNFNEVWADIESPTSGLPHIPDRPVSIVNDLNGLDRLCAYALTDDEAEKLRQDPRIEGVEIPIEKLPGVEIKPYVIQNPRDLNPPGNFDKPPSGSSSGTSINWGLPRHINSSNVYGPNTTTSAGYMYALDGTGVDVVISDTGVQADHPEFTDANGVSRVQQINWATYVPALSTMTNPYQDTDGHGTHVAGITAGKTYGWAKNARIYAIPAAVAGAPSALDQFAAIKLWHLSKNGSRPTVVNMSWGLSWNWTYLGNLPSDTKVTQANIRLAMNNFLNTILGVSYQGKDYLGNANLISKGLLLDTTKIECLLSFLGGIPRQSLQVTVALEDLIGSGVTVVHAAGNNSYKIDTPTGTGDYNNSVITTNGRLYYQRGGSPQSNLSICVGNMDSMVNVSGVDQKSTNSTTGPGVDIYAAGTNIMSSATSINSLTSDYAKSAPYFLNSNYRQSIKSGTSMASPQVAGMCALYLQRNPTATPAQVKAWITNSAARNLHSTGLTNDYTDFRSTLGGPNYIGFQNILGLSYVKDQSGAWKPVNRKYVNTETGWKQIKYSWIKTANGWRKTANFM